jgi:hypothetical protein
MKNKKTNAANILRLLGIIVIATVIAFSTASCFVIPDDDDDIPNTSLNGSWSSGGDTIRINGSSGVYTRIGSHSGYWQDAINKGYIYVNGPAFQNLYQTGDLTWTGERRVVSYNPSTNVAAYSTWADCTITMDSNGKTFYSYTPGVTNPSGTWTRQ